MVKQESAQRATDIQLHIKALQKLTWSRGRASSVWLNAAELMVSLTVLLKQGRL
jgi:hypothetical protein